MIHGSFLPQEDPGSLYGRPSAAAGLSVVSLLHYTPVVLQPPASGRVHRQLQRHFSEHLTHRHLRHTGWISALTSGTRVGQPYLLEVELLEHGDADLVVQANLHLELFDSEFVDP